MKACRMLNDTKGVLDDISQIGIRRGVAALIGYDDRNDGFMRKYFSSSCHKHSRNTKQGKIVRIRPEHRNYYNNEEE